MRTQQQPWQLPTPLAARPMGRASAAHRMVTTRTTIPPVYMPRRQAPDKQIPEESHPIIIPEEGRPIIPEENRPIIPEDSTPIIYHYLTFETVLPQPSSSIPTTPSGLPAPPPPDLKRYTSPFDWPESRKSAIVWLSSIATLCTACIAGGYAPAAQQMAEEWNVSALAIEVGITTFCSGFAIAPMVLAPFSEINGRYPVFAVAGVLYVICLICCAITRSYAGMLAARFGVGCGASVFSTMVGGVVSDLYHAHDRNTPMSLFAGGALFGTGLGPLVAGFIAQNTSWRWVFWFQTIFSGVIILTMILFLKETRGSVLLSQKATRLNKWYEEREKAGYIGVDFPPSNDGSGKTESQRIRWKVKADEERESISKMISISVYRPFHLLFTEPVVFFFSLWVSFSWGVLYLTFGAIPLVFQRAGFTLQQANSVFAAMCVATMLSTVLSIYQDRLLERYLAASSKTVQTPSWLQRSIDFSSPESRLYFVCIESALLPIGLFWFGWTSFPSDPWILPALAVGCATMGIYSIYLATFNYLADTYHRYASSALAAQSFCRNMLGGIFPLVTVALFNNLTYQGAGSLLGGVAVLLTCVPWVLAFYGPKIRARSKFAGELAAG